MNYYIDFPFVHMTFLDSKIQNFFIWFNIYLKVMGRFHAHPLQKIYNLCLDWQIIQQGVCQKSQTLQVAKKHVKRWSTSLVIREMNLISHHQDDYNLKKKGKIISVGEDVAKLEPSCIAHGNVKQCSHYEKQFVRSSKELPYDPIIPLLAYTQKN